MYLAAAQRVIIAMARPTTSQSDIAQLSRNVRSFNGLCRELLSLFKTEDQGIPILSLPLCETFMKVTHLVDRREWLSTWEAHPIDTLAAIVTSGEKVLGRLMKDLTSMSVIRYFQSPTSSDVENSAATSERLAGASAISTGVSDSSRSADRLMREVARRRFSCTPLMASQIQTLRLYLEEE